MGQKQKVTETIAELIARQISNKADVYPTDEERAVIERSLRANRERLRVFEAAVASQRAERITRLLRAVRHVEDELLQTNRIQNATTRELINLFRALAKDINDNTDYIHKASQQESLSSLLTTIFEQPTEQEESLDTEQRKRVRAVIEQLISAAGKNGSVARRRPRLSS